MSLNVIGLISGGKDSLYSLAHCVQNGHKIVALANLYPADAKSSSTGKEGEDLNSFMYQTVGYSAIPLYAEALNVPLYRREINGAAVQKGKDYEAAELQVKQNDETEDMFFLLKEILAKHPDANALSAGAILSTYQRTRVESVAIRLGLVPLAYLWQYPALPPPSSRADSLTGLLDDMSMAGCDARIIKLASGGIRSSLVFANVASQACKSQLLTGLSRFYAEPGQEFELRGAILGEGGEYETLALDGPANIWKRRIDADLEETFETDGVVYAKFGTPTLVEKDCSSRSEMPIPALLDERFHAVLKMLEQSSSARQDQTLSNATPSSTNVRTFPSTSQVGGMLQICNLTAPGNTAAEQLTNIIDDLSHSSLPQQIQDSFSDPKNLFHHIISTTLLLSSIEVFAEVNRIYSARLWPLDRAIPPARVTIAAFLPSDVHVSLSLTLDTSENGDGQRSVGRDGLHVQSRSYWAPANIGPYSQTVSAGLVLSNSTLRADDSSVKVKTVQMAGQIPLQPSSMQLSEGTFKEQAALALQHLWRVGQERTIDLWLGAGVAYLCTLSQSGGPQGRLDTDTARSRAQEAAAVWQLAHILDEKGKNRSLPDNDEKTDEDEEDVDVWHLHQNRGLVAKMTIGEHLYKLPNYNSLSVLNELRANDGKIESPWGQPDGQALYIPPFVAAEVKELPRYASIEWWSTGIAGLMRSDLRQCSSVHSFHRVISKGCIATGMFIRCSKTGEANQDDEVDEDEDHGVQSERSNTFTFFWALLVNMDADEAQLNKVFKEPSQALLQSLDLDISSASRQASALHSFLSLSAPQAMQDVIANTESFKQSVIVPCKHVWTSTYQQNPHEPFKFPEVHEVAMAMILRLDVR